MSLSWRKRQALASDQKTWRGLGHDSALWTSIENNASTDIFAYKVENWLEKILVDFNK